MRCWLLERVYDGGVEYWGPRSGLSPDPHKAKRYVDEELAGMAARGFDPLLSHKGIYVQVREHIFSMDEVE